MFVSRSFAPRADAERIWRAIAGKRAVELGIIDINSDSGRELATGLRINAVPAVATDGRLLAIGVQTPEEAHRLLAAEYRRAGAAR